MPFALPPFLLGYSRWDVIDQTSPWRNAGIWPAALANHPNLLAELQAEVTAHGGIRRVFVHQRALSDPVELFLAAMAWGFGTNVRFPLQRQMLTPPHASGAIAAIVDATQQGGAIAGWDALLVTNRVPGLEMAFGTKLLYFAGYSVDSPGPRPLILDARVRTSLVSLGTAMPAPPQQVTRDDYLQYLEDAAQWAGDPRWNESPEVVEYALFRRRPSGGFAATTTPDPTYPTPEGDIGEEGELRYAPFPKNWRRQTFPADPTAEEEG
jgi:hypothetical protein